MKTKYFFGLASKTLFRVYFFVNFINLFPLKIRNPTWQSDITSLLIDTFSILALGFIFKILSIKNEDFEKFNRKIAKESFIIFLFLITLGFTQLLILPGSLTNIDFIYTQRISQLNDTFDNYEETLSKNLKNKENQVRNLDSGLYSEEDKNRIKSEFNAFLVERDTSLNSFKNEKASRELLIKQQRSTSRMVVIRNNLRTFILSFIWSLMFLIYKRAL